MRYVEITPEDIVIEIRTKSFGRIGQIDFQYVSNVKLIKRFNNIGTWDFDLANEYWLRDQLAVPGRGIIVTLYDKVFISGPMTSFNNKRTTDDPRGTTSFAGVDELVYLSDGLAYPTPTTADVTKQTTAYHQFTGACETVLKHYVNINIGPGAPAIRQAHPLQIGPDLARGTTVTGSSRFDQLGPFMSDLALAGGNIGFDLTQQDDHVLFEVYQPYDRSNTVRMDIDNDLLTEVDSGISAPSVTRDIVAGQGEGDARTFIEVTDNLSIAAETDWGRRIEVFDDQRDTNDVAQLTQYGVKALQDGGRTTVSLKVTPSDNETMRFGKEWFVGDTVSVVVDNEELKDTVTEAILVMDTNGVRIGATVGDPTGYDYQAVLIKQVSKHEKRLQALEKAL